MADLNKVYNLRPDFPEDASINIAPDPAYSTSELKRLAQAVIHFEPALKALAPSDWATNIGRKSNWINNPHLGLRNLSRAESIAHIGTIEDSEQPRSVAGLIQKGRVRNYCWNFTRHVVDPLITYRQIPKCTTSSEMICWIELVTTFVRASIKCDSSVKLQKVPPNIRGLRWFLLHFAKDEVYPEMARLWAGKDLDAIVEPSIYIDSDFMTRELSPKAREERWKELNKLLEDDRKRLEELARTARPPYW